MRPQAFLFGLVLALSHGAYAQQADKMPRVGVLTNAPLTSPHYQAFLQGLHDLGYLEARTSPLQLNRRRVIPIDSRSSRASLPCSM